MSAVSRLDMPIEHYNKLPASLQPLLTRAFSYAVRARWHEVDDHGPADRSKPSIRQAGGKVGRNDPCPCGSGRKYKQCHARLVSQSELDPGSSQASPFSFAARFAPAIEHRDMMRRLR